MSVISHLLSLLYFTHRLGEPFEFRGRQTLCKYYDQNEILNEQLLKIKSAGTVDELGKLFNEQLRHRQVFDKSTKSIEPYYDTKAILAPSKSLTNGTCHCTKDHYQFNSRFETPERRHSSEFRTSSTPTVNAIKNLNCRKLDENSINDYIHLASECYDTCIQCYLNNLNECNRKAEIVQRHTIKSPANYEGRRSLKSNKISDLTLIHHKINLLNINLETNNRDKSDRSPSPELFHHRQSTTCSLQTMSCNENNNKSDGKNQLKDPPEIIFSDHSTNQQSPPSDNSEEHSDAKVITDKNCLKIPITNYFCSESRPP